MCLPIYAQRDAGSQKKRSKRDCMKVLDKNIWHSSITLIPSCDTQCAHHSSPVIQSQNVHGHVGHAGEARCFWRIPKMQWQAHITNPEVWERTERQPISDPICTRRLQLFRHIVQSKEDQDQSRALNLEPCTCKDLVTKKGQVQVHLVAHDGGSPDTTER